MQRCRVREEGFRIVNLCLQGRKKTVPEEEDNMSKATKVFLILFVSVFTAGVAANIICEIFKTRLQKYYSVD